MPHDSTPSRYVIQKVGPGTLHAALEMIRNVFMERVAPGFEAESILEFMASVNEPSMRFAIESGETVMWECRDGETVAGVMAYEPPSHISLLFVDARHRHQGIAKALLAKALDARPGEAFTVNASSYAVGAYRALGFRPVGPARTENGVSFTPMQRPAQP